MTERLHFHFSLSCIGEGNVSPLQCSCLENPRDGRAWWAAIYGVAQSRTQLERLSSNMGKETVNQLQEAQRVAGRINPGMNTPGHTVIKLTKIKDLDKILKATREKDNIQGNSQQPIS